jgi:hypothetical protein
VTRTAFRARTTVRRSKETDERISSNRRATSAGLAATTHNVTSGRSVRRRRPSAEPERETRRVHLGRSWLGATPEWGDATDRDGTVITVRSGRTATCGNTVTAPTTLRCGRSIARPVAGSSSSSGAGTARGHQFQLRMVRPFLVSKSRRPTRRRASSVPAAYRRSFRSPGMAREVTSRRCDCRSARVAGRMRAVGHHVQLRIGRLPPDRCVEHSASSVRARGRRFRRGSRVTACNPFRWSAPAVVRTSWCPLRRRPRHATARSEIRLENEVRPPSGVVR